jgi:hypothetical protein
MPRRALAILLGIARRGAEWIPRFAGRTGTCFPANLDKNARAQDEAAFGSPFLWILSFGEAKESITLASAGTGFYSTVAIATHKRIKVKLNSYSPPHKHPSIYPGCSSPFPIAFSSDFAGFRQNAAMRLAVLTCGMRLGGSGC